MRALWDGKKVTPRCAEATNRHRGASVYSWSLYCLGMGGFEEWHSWCSLSGILPLDSDPVFIGLHYKFEWGSRKTSPSITRKREDPQNRWDCYRPSTFPHNFKRYRWLLKDFWWIRACLRCWYHTNLLRLYKPQRTSISVGVSSLSYLGL